MKSAWQFHAVNSLAHQVTEELVHLRERGLYRKPLVVETKNGVRALIDGRDVILFSSNDYLGLSQHPQLIAASVEATRLAGTGAGASRLISGNLSYYSGVEQALAELTNCEAAVVFASGYAANIGIIPALAGPLDVILADELNHASLVDACRLSRAEKKIFPHRDMDALERLLKESGRFRRRFILTDGVFSVDGDIAPLPDIVRLAHTYHASVILDDAHAIGVLGDAGGGTVEHFGLAPSSLDVRIGTLSKAAGCAGGFVCASRPVVELLFNRARSLIYSTAIPPGTFAAATVAVRLMRDSVGLRSHLKRISSHVRSALTDMGFDTGHSECHIIPIIIGDEKKALELSSRLLEQGVFVPALRPPTVPPNSSRLRISLSAIHTDRDVEVLLCSLREISTQ